MEIYRDCGRRAEGPAVNRPDREVGINEWNKIERRRRGTSQLRPPTLQSGVMTAGNESQF
jgi:hypothetical protein